MIDFPLRQLLPALLILPLVGCAAGSPPLVPRGLQANQLPIDLDRFMGDWHVLAHIPTRPERNAYDALEQYTLREDGRIDIRFTFCEGAPDGPFETMEMIGWVHDDETKAEWRVRPFWPLRLGYQILELDPDYSLTVIGHPSRRYAWVMARRPEIEAETLSAITERLAERGFDTDRLRLVPQSAERCRAAASGP